MELLKNFSIYRDGSDDLQGVADIELPSLEPMTETIKGAGIAGEIEVPIPGHFGSMKIKLNWRSVNKAFLAMIRQTGQRLDCRGSVLGYDSGQSQYKEKQVKVIAQVLPPTVTFGKFEPGTPMDSAHEFEVVYLKVSYDYRIMMEIDKPNFICVIDGVDYMAETRSILGK